MTLAFGMPGASEMLMILAVVFIFFGAGKLPDVMGQMGRGIRAFKDGISEGEEEERRREIAERKEREAARRKADEVAASEAADPGEGGAV